MLSLVINIFVVVVTIVVVLRSISRTSRLDLDIDSLYLLVGLNALACGINSLAWVLS